MRTFSLKIARHPVPRRERLPRPRLQRLAVPAFAALVLLVAPVPVGAAQPAPRPKPEKLWRQFPLETERANQDARANGRPTPRVAPQTTVGTPEDQGGGSVVTVQTAAIVLAVANVLILMLGTRAYVQNRSLELTTRHRSRRSIRLFRRSDDLRHAARTAWRQVGIATNSLRRATSRVAEASNAARTAIARFQASIASEAAALKTQLSVRVVPTNDDGNAINAVASAAADKPAPPEARPAQRVPVQEAAAAETLKDRLDLYLDPLKSKSMARANLDNLEAERDPHVDLPRRPADDELEILKAKLGKPAAPADDLRADEVETLKAKLGGETAGGITTRNELKRKLAERRAKEGESRNDEVDLLKAKREALDQVADADAAASVDRGRRDAALGEPQGGRPADLAPPPSQASPAPPRSRAAEPALSKLTASPSKPSSATAARSRRRHKHWFLLELERREARRRPEPPDGERG